jgi:iron complex outermembrane recepter protein
MPGNGELELTGYYVPRNLGPFQQIGVRIPQSFTNRGVSARYLVGAPLAGLENRLTFGADFQNTPILTGVFSVQTGAASAGLEENATTAGLYVLEELSLTEILLLTVGARYDHIEFSSRNLAREGSPRAGRTFRRATPKVGLTLFPSPLFSFYGNISQAFEAPIIGELRTLPGGVFGFNDQLEPQTSTAYEIGARGQPFPWLDLESALFRQDVRNLISPVGTFPQNSFQNLGQVRQAGLELRAEVRAATGIDLLTTYSFSDFTIEELQLGNQELSGNELPGVPRHNGFLELGYRHHTGLRGAINANHVGGFYFDNANTARNGPHTIVNLRAALNRRGRGLGFSPFLGLNNLTDETYSQFPVINDAGRRFYNPLPGRHVFAGAAVTF